MKNFLCKLSTTTTKQKTTRLLSTLSKIFLYHWGLLVFTYMYLPCFCTFYRPILTCVVNFQGKLFTSGLCWLWLLSSKLVKEYGNDSYIVLIPLSFFELQCNHAQKKLVAKVCGLCLEGVALCVQRPEFHNVVLLRNFHATHADGY